MARFWLWLLLPACLGAQVELSHKADRVDVSVNGRPFGALYFGKDANKPFFYPLRTASGKKVTRSFPMEHVAGEPTDHPHQKGLWVGAERLSGMDFWENDSSYKRPRMGKIVFRDVTRMASGREGVLGFKADWISLEGSTIISETQSMTFYSEPKDARIVDVDLNLNAREAVTFEDHQDAVIGIRLAPAFDEAHGGEAVNAEGLRGEAGARGRASRFLDWRTNLDGEEVGVAILDHPENLNAPARWHLRAFGFMTANPFARKVFDEKAESAAKTMKPGESLHLRYRVIVHSADFDLEAAFQDFAGAARPQESGTE
jgi:hypothetical protein